MYIKQTQEMRDSMHSLQACHFVIKSARFGFLSTRSRRRMGSPMRILNSNSDLHFRRSKANSKGPLPAFQAWLRHSIAMLRQPLLLLMPP